MSERDTPMGLLEAKFRLEDQYSKVNGRLTVALNALAAIAQDLGVPAGSEYGADWVGGITAAIRTKIAESRALATNYQRALEAIQGVFELGRGENAAEREAARQHYAGEVKRCEEFLETTGAPADTTLPRELIRRRLADHCAADSNECAIRRQCTNKCGRMPSEGQ